MSHGLSEQTLATVRDVLQQFSDVTSVVLFGSRALGHHQPGSDVDLALLGAVSPATVRKISMLLNQERPLPYQFDIVAYDAIQNAALRAHIDQYGQPLYVRKNVAS